MDLIPGRVKREAMKMVFIACLLDVQQKKDMLKPTPCVMETRAGGSLTRRRNDLLSSGLGNSVNKYNCNCNLLARCISYCLLLVFLRVHQVTSTINTPLHLQLEVQITTSAREKTVK